MSKLSGAEKKAYYLAALEDHRQLLKDAIAKMAEGNLVHALNIATSIRALVHETGSSKPLLKSLRADYLSMPILTGKPPKLPRPLRPNEHAAWVLHVAANFSIRDNQLSLNPTLIAEHCEETTLGRWWTDLGLRVPGAAPLSRRDIILGISNKESAHVDDDMPRNYRVMLQSKSIRIKINDAEEEVLNITRYVCGTAGVQMLDCLERHF